MTEQSTSAGVSLGVKLRMSLGDKVHVRVEDVGAKHQIRQVPVTDVHFTQLF